MKKLLVLILAIIMTISLVACGGETPTDADSSTPTDSTAEIDNAADTSDLVEVTSDTGVTMKLPSDLVLQENQTYMNTTNGDNVVFKVQDGIANPLSGWTQDIVFAGYSDLDSAEAESFENGIQINGYDALISKVNYKTSSGVPTKSVFVVVTDGTYNYAVSFTFDIGAGSTLEENLQACIDSITIPVA